MVKPSGNKRISKEDTYLNCAEVFAYRSTCLKRKYGAVVVKTTWCFPPAIMVRPEGLRIAATLGNVRASSGICTRGRATRCAEPSMRRQTPF